MTTLPKLGPEDLYEGREDCGCNHTMTTVPKGQIVKRLKTSVREIIAAEPLEAIAEPIATEKLEAIAEPRVARLPPPPVGSNPPIMTPSGLAVGEDRASKDRCLPWVRITRDVDRMRACMRLSEQIGRIETSKQLYDTLRDTMEPEEQELYVVVALDTQLHLRGIAEVARGARDRVLTPIQDTVRYAIAFAQLYGAMGIAIAHNHPSGKARPSDADKEVTKVVAQAAAVNDLLFVDHIILGLSSDGRDAYYSFRDNGEIKT